MTQEQAGYHRETRDGSCRAWYGEHQGWTGRGFIFFSWSPWHTTGSGTIYRTEEEARAAVDRFIDVQMPEVFLVDFCRWADKQADASHLLAAVDLVCQAGGWLGRGGALQEEQISEVVAAVEWLQGVAGAGGFRGLAAVLEELCCQSRLRAGSEVWNEQYV